MATKLTDEQWKTVKAVQVREAEQAYANAVAADDLEAAEAAWATLQARRSDGSAAPSISSIDAT